jgi:hypothetical protein
MRLPARGPWFARQHLDLSTRGNWHQSVLLPTTESIPPYILP